MQSNLVLVACLADEELKAEEDSIEETKKRVEEQSRRAQLEVQMREEEKRIREERMYVLYQISCIKYLRYSIGISICLYFVHP